MDRDLPWHLSQAGRRRSAPLAAARPRGRTTEVFSATEWSVAEWLQSGLAGERAREVKQILDSGRGSVILKGFPVDDRTEEQTMADFEAFVRVFGPVTLHGESKKPIWKVSPRASLDHVPTFSETASEAPLHTDNSWVPAPERYVGLLVLHPASDGGDSILFSSDELKREFAATEPGPEAIRILTEHRFPFAMPEIFRGGSEAAEVVTSPVFGSPLGFRFRHDVILAGFEARPDLATVESVWAVEAFNAFLLQVLEGTQGTRLERGDVLLANNHRVLHARTHFTDPRRLLLRARMIEGQS